MAFKILLVDDKIDDRNDDISQLPNLLRKAGYDVKATADGETAYDLVWEYEPDLIVLDVDLGIPHADGIDVCEAVRTTEQAERRPGIPIS